MKRISKKTKGFFIDTGFVCQLHQISSSQQLLSHRMAGALFETSINNMLYTVINSFSYGVGMYHWRSHNGAEIYIVLSCNGALYPVEVKMSTDLSGHASRGIRAFKQTYQNEMPVKLGIIVYAGTTCHMINEDVIAVPCNMFCSR